MITPEIVKTDDGSDTLFAGEYGEHYHSTFGAVQESMYVFIGAGLRNCAGPSLNLFEMGFGTGLNAYLTALETIRTNKYVRYFTVEKYPLSQVTWSKLNYPYIVPNGNAKLFQIIHEAEWDNEVIINDHFSIYKIHSDLKDIDYSLLPLFDLIYFDAFSPEKQHELWETDVFAQLANHGAPLAKLVTYCAKGSVRRSLSDAGFMVSRIPGPPGKREIVSCTKSSVVI